jgi:general secretion pathway protein H
LFQKDDSVFKDEKKLPEGLMFKSLESVDQEPLTTGTGYIYFYANGFVEASALQITDRKKINWTIIYHPLTGQADIIPQEKNLKDAQQKQ